MVNRPAYVVLCKSTRIPSRNNIQIIQTKMEELNFTDYITMLIGGGLDPDSAVMVALEAIGYPANGMDTIWDRTGQLWFIQQPVPEDLFEQAKDFTTPECAYDLIPCNNFNV